jgi:hypothetical protein
MVVSRSEKFEGVGPLLNLIRASMQEREEATPEVNDAHLQISIVQNHDFLVRYRRRWKVILRLREKDIIIAFPNKCSAP